MSGPAPQPDGVVGIRRRRARAAGGIGALVLLAACGATPTTPNRTTETFSGTLQQSSSVFHNFTVATAGTVDVSLTSLSPQTTITVGLAVGQPVTAGCNLFSSNESAKVGTTISGDLSAGAYCVGLYDIGNLTGPLNYSLTVTHP